MKEFIEKLIGRLEENGKCYARYSVNTEGVKSIPTHEAISIVNQLAEEYNGGWITDRNPTKEECQKNRFWITDSYGWNYEADFDLECERWRDLETGGFIEVIAWYILPLPAPYQPKGENELYRAKSVDGVYQEYNGDWK